MKRDSNGAAFFWGVVALGAVGMGVVAAVVAGYLLGHYTHTRTKTVAERTVTATAPAPLATDAKSTAISTAQVGPASRLSTQQPKLAGIGQGLQGPSNVRASVFARGIKNVEVMTPAPSGALFAATGQESAKPVNSVFLLKRGAKPVRVIKRLGPTIGLAWTNNQLYVSSPGTVDVYTDFTGTGFGAHRRILKGLPVGKLGWNGDIHSGPDGRMYMAIGAPCDHCVPADARSATIVSFRRDGSDMRFYATGVRGNAFFAWAPGTTDMFMVSNNRDDKKPPRPDEYGLVRQGDDWGYPRCFRQGGPSCAGVAKPLAYMDAHAASDGLTFLTHAWGDAKGLSTISTEWTLGKVIQTSLTRRGDVYTAKPQVAMSGFKNPSGVLTMADGKTVMIADYGTGVVYSVAPGRAPTGASSTAQAKGQGSSSNKQADQALKPDSSLKAAADPSGALKFTTSKLSAKAGSVDLDFTNKSAVPHNFAIKQGSKQIGTSKTITSAEDKSAVVKLTKGTYTFYCTVPGHEQAGMKGTLTVR